ncbi:MAG TPA: hypothetical protein VFU30_14945 [Gaiellaceae bacterium]|nr:hypothetical protein [Gaiellaceae bacterium]
MTLVVSPGEGSTQKYMQWHWARPLADILAGAVKLFSHDWARLSTELPCPDDLFYVGHGSPTALGSPPLFDTKNIAEINGRIVAIACRSAMRLGPEAVADGRRRYVGFVDDLHVIDAEVLDDLIVRTFKPLLTNEWSEAEFEDHFKKDCERVQASYFAGRRRRTRDAHIIASAAQVMKLSVRVL